MPTATPGQSSSETTASSSRDIAAPTPPDSTAKTNLVLCSLREFVLYFLRLGTFGFGGPIALAGYMQRDLVEERRWLAPYFRRFSSNRSLKAFVDGVTAAATGAIAGAAFVLGQRALVDVATTAIAMVTLGALVKIRNVQEPVLIATAGLVGVALKNI